MDRRNQNSRRGGQLDAELLDVYQGFGVFASQQSGHVAVQQGPVDRIATGLLQAQQRFVGLLQAHGDVAGGVVTDAIGDGAGHVVLGIALPLRGGDLITKRRTPLIDGFQNTPAAKMLAQQQKESNELVCEAFVSAAQGEKVCFLEKTSSYIHKGKAKFDVPFTTGKPWQGEPTFDESTQTHSLQFSVPVFPARKEGDDPKAERKAIGVLTVGLNFTQLQENVKKSGK